MTEHARTNILTRRARALQPKTEVRATLSIVPLTPAARFTLRLEEQVAARLGVLGAFRIDIPINTCSGAQATFAARLGPNEWLLLAPEDESERLEWGLRARLAGLFHSLVDVSHRSVAIAVKGAHARVVLNGGCPLDLHDDAFPAGTAKRTLLGKAEITLLRPGVERNYRIECWRSFSPYVRAFLLDVAREF